ncbi:MAG: Na+/H+ antiporter subunit E [Thermomicrobiales bacterium]
MIFLIAVTIGLASTYCLTIASFAWEDIVFGLIVAAGLVAIFRRALFPATLPEAGHVFHIVAYLPVLIWMLLIDILKGTWLVVKYVVGIEKLDHPGIVKIPLGGHSRTGVGIVSLLVTISPGSFVVDIDWEDSSMLVHYIDASNPAQLRRDVEKYYRIWEYGSHLPRDSDEDFVPESRGRTPNA